jgi:signal peptidase I
MTSTHSGFEERLLPILVEDLRERQSTSRVPRSRGNRRRWTAALAAAAVVVVVALVTSSGPEDAPLTFVVTSGAMAPTLAVGQQVAVDPSAYRSAPPARGDIIAFTIADYPGLVAIKRVVGVAGDTVEERSGVVFVNGRALDEPYASLDTYSGGASVVMPGNVFVMGDNRPNSNDSRYSMGQIPVTDIVGKVLLGVTPEDRPQSPPPPMTTQSP